MTTIRQWLEEVRLGRLSLGDLVTRINSRGNIPDDEHLREIEDLDALLRESKIDPRLYRAVKSKLGELQGSTVTRTRTPIVPDERTVFMAPPSPPAASPKPPVEDDDDPMGSTIISPSSLLPPRSPTTTATGQRPKPAAPTPPEPSDDATRLYSPNAPVAPPEPPRSSTTTATGPRPVRPQTPPAAPPPSDDATRIYTPGMSTGPADDDGENDATQMLRPGDMRDDGTRLLPPDKRIPQAGSYEVPPASSTTQSRTGSHTASQTGTGTGTSGTSGGSARAWRKLADAEAPVDKVDVGSRLKDRFVLEKKIGTGGMGVVFLAIDERKIEARDRNPRVAVKVLNDEFRQHPDSLIALQRESRRSQQLAHDNIVRVYDFDKDGSIVFMTMEYVDGEDLKNMIRSLDGKGMTAEAAFPIIEGMGRALERAHREGVVHSDFKPGNVMLTNTNVPKVFDFGIARAGKRRAGEAAGEQTVFDAGTLGALTPAYASLEMLQGKDSEPPDDLYALACVAYEMLGGKHPFNKINAEQAMKQGLVPQRIMTLSKLQWRTLQRGLAFRREDRIATAAEFIEGMRPRTQREKTLPLIAMGAGGLIGLIVLIWLVNVMLYKSKIGGVEDCIGSAECSDAAVLVERLRTLDAGDQKRIGEDRRDEIKGIFYGTLARHWAPEKSAYNYTEAKKVVELAFGLYGTDSAWVKELGDGLEADRNTQLSRLNDEFSKQIDGAVFKTASDDGRGLLSVLEAVRAIDPSQPMLKDGRIAQAFERGVRDSYADPQLGPTAQIDLATKRLEVARKYITDPAILKPLESGLQTRREQLASTADEEQRLAAARAQKQQRLDAVSKTLASAADTSEWRTSLRNAWLAAREAVGESNDQLEKIGQTVSNTLLAQSTASQQQDDLESAAESARLGLELLPGDARLDRQFKAVSSARDRRIAQASTEADRTRLSLARIDQLLARPAGTTAWIGEVDNALKAVTGKADPADIKSRRDQLAVALDKLVTEAVAASDFQRAEPLASRAATLDPSDRRLAGLPAKVNEGRRAAQAGQLAKLDELVRQKSFTPEWQKAIDAALAAVRGVQDPALPKLLDTLGAAYAERAQSLAQEKSYSAAKQIADAGIKRVPQSTALQTAKARVDELEKQDSASKEQANAQFKIQELERTIALKSAAAELPDAIAALQQLRKLDAENVYANTEGPKQIAEGALKLAERFATKKDFDNAIKAVDRGLGVLKTSALTQARTRYETAGCAAELDRELLKRGSIADARRTQCLATVKKNDSAAAAKYKPLEGGSVTPTPTPTPVPTPVPTPTPTPTPTPVPTPVPESPPPVSSSPDPCKKSFSGHGTRSRGQCTDPLMGDQGPIIVVVAGLGTFGITQMEIANLHYAMYCRATGACTPPTSDHLLPVTRVSVADAKGFAKWLSNATGRRYRLPTEAEWRHAATVAGRDPLIEGYCRVMQGDKVITTAPRQVNAGVMNDWGLVNTVGNVRELTDSAGTLIAVGGSYQDEPRDCDAEARRPFTGPDEATGFRLLRELD